MISTLADDEADYNYWNQAFWVHFPKPAVEQAEGKTIFKAFSFGSELSANNAGSWAGKGKIVRLAQCEIPDSDFAETLLIEQFIKFDEKLVDVFNRQLKSKAGDWECIEFYHTYDCEYDPSEGMVICTIVDTHCVTWVYVEEPPISGGGGGFPGNDPGECDPMGTEPCFDGGVGSSIPPPEPDPCEEINPPAWCSCEETDDPNLDNKGVKEQVYSLMEASNANDPDQNKRKEQGMWIIKDPNTGEYGYSLFDEGWSNFTACGIEYDNPIIPPNTVAMIHTQPFEIGEIPYPCEEGRISKAQLDAFIQINPALRDQYEYKGTPSANDLQLVQTIQNQNSDIQFYLVDKEGITEYDETSTTDDLSNSTRHTQSCFQN